MTFRPTGRRTFLKRAAAASTILAAPYGFVRPARAATRKIRFGIIPAYSFGMYWLAQDRGFLAERDIELDIRVFPSGPPGIEAMVGGSIDVLTVGSVPPLAAMARRVADFREFSICGDATPRFVVVGKAGMNAAGAVDACVPLATSRHLIFEARPDAVVTVNGSELPDGAPSILDVIMTTQPYMDANEALLVDMAGALHGPTVAFQRNENDEAVAAMVRWQQGMGNSGANAENVGPIFNGWGYLNTAEIKESFAKGVLLNSARVQARFLRDKGRIDAMPDVDALVTDRIVRRI